jgi:hypothetical protein
MTITAANFPTPHLALRSSDPDEIDRVRQFAHEQARAAETALRELGAALSAARSRADRIAAFVRTHENLIQWRAGLARRTTRRLGTGIDHDASRFTMSLRDGGRNYDRLGRVGRLRENPVWDPESRTYRGGRATPAHLIMLEHGRVAIERFAAEDHDGDTLRNPVTLPDGGRIDGNSLVRGAAARRIAADLVARIARRGADTSRIETGGEPLYVVTAADADRERIFQAAMTALADSAPGDVHTWQAVRYLLYQSPMTKKGSDAVTRVFLIVVGSILLGRPPVLDHDVDLRCIVAGQPAATALPSDPGLAFTSAGRSAPPHGEGTPTV